jgi:hypothetical protein
MSAINYNFIEREFPSFEKIISIVEEGPRDQLLEEIVSRLQRQPRPFMEKIAYDYAEEAAKAGNKKIFKIFFSYGYFPAFRNAELFFEACRCGRLEIVKYILKHRKTFPLTNFDINRGAHCAIDDGQVAVAQFLYSYRR